MAVGVVEDITAAADMATVEVMVTATAAADLVPVVEVAVVLATVPAAVAAVFPAAAVVVVPVAEEATANRASERPRNVGSEVFALGLSALSHAGARDLATHHVTRQVGLRLRRLRRPWLRVGRRHSRRSLEFIARRRELSSRPRREMPESLSRPLTEKKPLMRSGNGTLPACRLFEC